MKVAMFVHSWPPGTAATGIVTYTAQLVPALRRLGHEVFVITSTPTTKEKDPYRIDLPLFVRSRIWDRVICRFAPARNVFAVVSRALECAVEQLVRDHGIQVLEMEESFGWTIRTSQRRILPVVVRLHGPWFLTGKFYDLGATGAVHRGRSEREGQAIAAADLVSANCEDTLRRVRRYYGLSLDNSRIVPTPLDAADEASIWSIDRCVKDTILFIGRFDRLKGADVVLHAFHRLASANPRLRLTFVGPDVGIEMPHGRMLKFEEFVRRQLPHWVRERIDFRGRLDHAQLMSVRTQHHITVIAAQFDTFGYMLLEPMSLGCPLVTTAVGGIPEVITDGANGMLIPSQDVDAMVTACQRLLSDDALAARVGRQAWQD